MNTNKKTHNKKMNNLLTRMYQVAGNQKRNLTRTLRGFPNNPAPLGSSTLDMDDVKIARGYLKNRTQWNDEKKVKEFETQFAKWNLSKHAFAFASGRVALSACIYALGLEPGDEVILPAYTCVVVSNAFQYAGIKPIYCDIELDTYGIDCRILKSLITLKTRAIMLHHLYGLVSRDYLAIIQIARENDLKVIEDCAQATGAEFRGRKVGNYGDCAIYSTEQSKVMNTGQGGIASTNNDQIASKLDQFYQSSSDMDEASVEGLLYSVIINYYRHKQLQGWWLGDLMYLLYGKNVTESTTLEEELGIKPNNYLRKMAPPIAALGLNQLKKIDHYNQLRRKTAIYWDKWCDRNGYKKPNVVPDSIPIFLRYPILVEPEKKKNTDWMQKKLKVQPGIWFVSNLHPANITIPKCPNARIAVNRCVNFPGVLL